MNGKQTINGKIIKLSELRNLSEIGMCPIPLSWDIEKKKPKNYPKHKEDIQSGNGKPNLDDITRWYKKIGRVNGIALALYQPHFMLDIDLKNSPDKSIFNQLLRIIEARKPDLPRKLCIEKTRSNGYHIYAKYSKVAAGKLARSEKGEEVIAIYTDGCLSYCTPTPGYELVHNDFNDIEELTEDEFIFLVELSKSFNKQKEFHEAVEVMPSGEYPIEYRSTCWEFDKKCTPKYFDKLLSEMGLFPVKEKNPKKIFKDKKGRQFRRYLRNGSEAEYSAKVYEKSCFLFSGSFAGWPMYSNKEEFGWWKLTRSWIVFFLNGKDWAKTIEIINAFLKENETVETTNGQLSHDEILTKLKSQVKRIDFQARAFPNSVKIKKQIEELRNQDGDEKIQEVIARLEKQLKEDFKVKIKHYKIITIEEIISIARSNNWGMCINTGFVYLYNGAYWKAIDQEGLEKFFGDISELLGVPKFEARDFVFRNMLLKQFISESVLKKPRRSRSTILVNFLNGTLELKSGKPVLRSFVSEDFITYQLPFEYNPKAKCPMWQKFLDQVIADKEKQIVLSEYFASAFINNNNLKLEKVLMLYGSGSNGKGVVYEVISALFGEENISGYSLENLTNENGYFRAMIVNKLINYSSENSFKLDSNIFKQLASNEPVSARLPYGKPFQATDYAKLVFNTNILPRDGIEQTHAFFRRFLIIPFDVVIPEEKQDKKLHLKIISKELPGIFNWVMEGLHRLINQEGFSKCDAAVRKLEEYRTQSCSVRSFLEEKEYRKSVDSYKLTFELFTEYRAYCSQSGVIPVSLKPFINRLRDEGFETRKMAMGTVVYISF